MTLAAGWTYADDQRWGTLSVRDSGPGLTPEEQAQVFDRFFRGRLAEIDGVQGAGLGLSKVREIARIHGGRATVESDGVSGSTFTLWLPECAPARSRLTPTLGGDGSSPSTSRAEERAGSRSSETRWKGIT